jgi:predicted metalloprotease with PDZ domain
VYTQISGIGSDHRVFLSNRIAAFNLTTGSHADRHGVDDESEKINSAGGAQVAWLAHRLLLDLVSSAEPIPFKPLDSRFDIGVLVRVAAGLGIVPSLGGTDAGHLQILVVLPGSAADKAGIEPGDQITALNGHPFERPEQIHAVWSALDLSQGLQFSLLRGDEQVEATIPAEVIEDLVEKASANRGGER